MDGEVQVMAEHITGVAIRCEDGRVFWRPKPARHSDVILDCQAACCDPVGHEQGFLTDKMHFVGRVVAAQIAAQAGQIPSAKPGQKLYSEDLW